MGLWVNQYNINALESNKRIFIIKYLELSVRYTFTLIEAVVIRATTGLLFISILIGSNIEFGYKDILPKGIVPLLEILYTNRRIITEILLYNSITLVLINPLLFIILKYNPNQRSLIYISGYKGYRERGHTKSVDKCFQYPPFSPLISLGAL